MNRGWIPAIVSLVLALTVAGCDTDNSAVQSPAPADSAPLPEQEQPSYFEQLAAQAIMWLPNFVIRTFGLKDINELVFGLNQEPGTVYGLFLPSMWRSIHDAYSLQYSLLGYLLVIAISVWCFLLVFRAGSPMAQMSVREMTNGFAIYIGAMWLGSYLFQIIFAVNTFLVKLGYVMMMEHFQQLGLPAHLSFMDIVAYALGSTTTIGTAGMAGAYFALLSGSGFGAGMAMVLAVLVIFIAFFNFQYAMRTAGLGFLMVLFPMAAYSSIFPGSRMSFDLWLRTFLALTLVQGLEAVFLGFMYSFLV
ncbi:hypothetical protein [Brevibacillus dissolubilis]|uniref:hypothetical protein n=1 Tax=Brevibacillus dissolubilis TaxID=1844116 RepID=UPI0011164EF5|nr:hypothetical protein [Brevibacillus dissolubilis]